MIQIHPRDYESATIGVKSVRECRRNSSACLTTVERHENETEMQGYLELRFYLAVFGWFSTCCHIFTEDIDS